MNIRTYVQGCGYHETSFAPPEVVAKFLADRGFEVEVVRLDRVDADAVHPANALVLLSKRKLEN